MLISDIALWVPIGSEVNESVSISVLEEICIQLFQCSEIANIGIEEFVYDSKHKIKYIRLIQTILNLK